MFLWCFLDFLLFVVVVCIKNGCIDVYYCVFCCDCGFYIV